MNYPVLNPLAWHIIGYEEYRLGHNYLVERGWQDMILPYHQGFDRLCCQMLWSPERVINGKKFPKTIWPPNSWHRWGCNECYEYWFFLPEQQKHEPLPDYIHAPVIESCHPARPEPCDWCGLMGGREGKIGCFASDYIQQNVFCCEQHLRQHREKLANVCPGILTTYQTYPFRPLPANPLKMQQYFNQLPDVLSDLVILEPIDLPVLPIQRPQIERVSTVNLADITSITLDD